MAEQIYRLPQVLALTGLGRSTLYAMMERGEFPRALRLGARARGWKESQLDEWLAGRLTTKAD